jgi:hypothetical protein
MPAARPGRSPGPGRSQARSGVPSPEMTSGKSEEHVIERGLRTSTLSTTIPARSSARTIDVPSPGTGSTWAPRRRPSSLTCTGPLRERVCFLEVLGGEEHGDAVGEQLANGWRTASRTRCGWPGRDRPRARRGTCGPGRGAGRRRSRHRRPAAVGERRPREHTHRRRLTGAIEGRASGRTARAQYDRNCCEVSDDSNCEQGIFSLAKMINPLASTADVSHYEKAKDQVSDHDLDSNGCAARDLNPEPAD